MGNTSSAEEAYREEGPSVRARPAPRRPSRRLSSARGHTPESGDSSEADDWEVLSSEAPRQMPSQQYYPMPWTHQLDSRTGESGQQISPGLSTAAGPGEEPSWRQVGRSLATGAVVLLQAVAEQQRREEEEKKRREREERERRRRENESPWRRAGRVLGAGAVGCAEVVVERQRLEREEEERQKRRENRRRQRNERQEEEENGAVSVPSAPPSSPPPARSGATAAEASYHHPSRLPEVCYHPPGRLPEVCYHHPGCSDPACNRLHLCLLLLADMCSLGDRCRRGHSLATEHNQSVCEAHQLDSSREPECLALLRRACEESGRLPLSLYRDHLGVCFWAACDGTCNKLHICRNWLAGDCVRPVCRFGHQLRTPHNSAVLRRHKMEAAEDAAICSLLREKYSAIAPKGAATAGGGDGQSRDRPQQQQQQQQAVGGALSAELECAVCLELFSRATTLGCGHTFCADCVRSVQRCPLCRAAITSSSRSVTLDSIVSGLTAKPSASELG